MKTKNRTKGTVMMFIGLLLLAAALFLTLYNIIDAKRAEKAAKAVIPDLQEQIIVKGEETEKPLEGTEMDMFLLADRDMPAIEIDGYRYVGILEIPALEMKLPIMEEWDYTRLKISPCLYEGSVYKDTFYRWREQNF